MRNKTMPPVMKAATAGTAGRKGLVPKPAAGDEGKFLRGDKTWQAVGASLSAATNLQASQSSSTTTALTPANALFAGSRLFNMRAPEGGVYVDGTAGARIFSTLAGQDLGTSGCAVSGKVRVPSSNPSADHGVFIVSSSATAAAARAWIGYFDSSGRLNVVLYGATTGDYNLAQVAAVVATHGGTDVFLEVVRPTSGDVLIYINGVAQTISQSTGGSPPTWQGSITSTYFGIGYIANTGVLAGAFRRWTLWNVALSEAEAQEVYFMGGAVPFRYQFGSQAELVTNGDMSSSAGWTTGAFTIGSGVATSNGTGDGGAGTSLNRTAGIVAGKAFRTGFTLAGHTSGSATLSPGGGTVSATARTADGTYSETVVAASNATALIYVMSTLNSGATVDNVSAVRVGAIVHLPMDEGVGYQLHDASTNKLDAVMTTTGVSHLISQRRGYIRTPGAGLTWTATHESKSVLGVAQQAIPRGAVTVLATLAMSAATSGGGATVGTTNSATRVAAATTYASALKKVLTLANQMPAGTAANDLDRNIDPDSANWTGTAQYEEHYVLTEGTP